jgi:hypothetical protein
VNRPLRSKKFIRYASRFLAVVCVVVMLDFPARAADVPSVYASQPWLGAMASFIVGTTMKVRSASTWDSSGALRARKIPQNSTAIALDPLDAARFNLDRNQKELHVLYDNLPIENTRRGPLPFDPSVLPFLSQRLLIVLCELSPDNYSFYQRRLAEFQSRLESTVEVGRSLIHDIPVLDLTGAVSPWVMAACGKAVRPPESLWNSWIGNTRTPDLVLAVKEAENRGWWILMDAWTPAPVRTRVFSQRIVLISPPGSDYDFFPYLHDIYLQIWSTAAAK